MKDLTELTSKCFTDFFVNTIETCGGKMKNNTYYGNKYILSSSFQYFSVNFVSLQNAKTK
jgi:hypothetical protein